jgi:hypothetical protein
MRLVEDFKRASSSSNNIFQQGIAGQAAAAFGQWAASVKAFSDSQITATKSARGAATAFDKETESLRRLISAQREYSDTNGRVAIAGRVASKLAAPQIGDRRAIQAAQNDAEVEIRLVYQVAAARGRAASQAAGAARQATSGTTLNL